MPRQDIFTKVTCSTCMFSKLVTVVDVTHRECRRYPPGIGERQEAVWPIVPDDEGCGEYQKDDDDA